MTRALKSGIFSLCFSGAGQIYNREWLKGAVFAFCGLVFLVMELSSSYYVEWLSGAIEGSFRIQEYGGIFARGLWGLFTLGTQARVVTDSGISEGDHSILLMIQGVFIALVLFIFIFFWVYSIVDAYKTAQRIDTTGQFQTFSYSKLLIQMDKNFAYFILTPIFILMLIFVITPMFFSFLIAFTNYNVYNLPPTKLVSWVGLQNFFDIFRIPIWSNTFSGVFIWNVQFMLVSTLSVVTAGFVLALLLNNRYVLGQRVWRAIFILPWAMPALISQLIFQVMFNGQFGPMNEMLLDWGVIAEKIYWFSNRFSARSVIYMVNVWLGAPYWMVLISGVMLSIDRFLYEAAKIDGANKWQEFIYFTLPLVLKSIGPLLIMAFAGSFNNFGLIYFLTQGGPSNPNYQFAGDTDILISWIYKLTLDQRMYNMASVMSILIFLFVGTVAIFNLRKTSALQD